MDVSVNVENLGSEFNERYSHCYSILKQSNTRITQQIVLELYAVMYVVSDFAAVNSNGDRKIVSNTILNCILHKLSLIYQQLPIKTLQDRISFYGTVISGLSLHAHCLLGKDISDAHPVLRCSAAFSDCYLYCGYIDNYHAPRPMLDAFDVFECSSEIMLPLYSEFVLLYNNIHDLSASVTAIPSDTSSAKSNTADESSSTKEDDAWFVWMCITILAIGCIVFLMLIISERL